MSRSESTRRRILDAARQLLEDAGGAPVSMREIATAAGVTRQLLYLHFDSRADLLLQVSRAADLEARTPGAQNRVDAAPDAATALRRTVALQGRIKPRIHAVARAVDRLRHTDADAAGVWDERERARLDRCRAVVARLAAEGRLREGWTVRTAAQLVWSATSLRAWEELVVEQGWSTRAWVQRTTTVLEQALVAGDDPPARS